MSRKLKIVLIGVLLGITVIGGGVWYFMEKVEQEKQELIQKVLKWYGPRKAKRLAKKKGK